MDTKVKAETDSQGEVEAQTAGEHPGEHDDGGWGQAYDDEDEDGEGRRRRSRSRSFS